MIVFGTFWAAAAWMGRYVSDGAGLDVGAADG